MFLRKWKAGQLAAGLLAAVFLVLSGINVMGLVQGQKAVKEAEARRFAGRWGLFLLIADFRKKVSEVGDEVKCKGDGISCITFKTGTVDDDGVETVTNEVLFSF